MADPTGDQGQAPLETDANAALDRCIAKFRGRLMGAAEEIYARTGQGGGVTSEHVEAAYKRLTSQSKSSRSEAQKNVTTAFKENRFIEMTGYTMALLLFISGLILLMYSAFASADVVSRIASLVGGSFAQILLLLPLRFAVNARRQNFAIRIFAYLIDRVDDSKLLAELIRRLIAEISPNRPLRNKIEGGDAT